MSRLSYDSLIMNALKFVRSCPDFRAFMSRLSCVRQTFVRSCSDFRAFMSRLSCVRQTFVRSCSDFRAFFDVSRLHSKNLSCEFNKKSCIFTRLLAYKESHDKSSIYTRNHVNLHDSLGFNLRISRVIHTINHVKFKRFLVCSQSNFRVQTTRFFV